MTFPIFTGDVRVFLEQQESLRNMTTAPWVTGQNRTQAGRWLIVGAGGFGREVYSWTLGQLHSTSQEAPVGFLDDNPRCFDNFPNLKPLWRGLISDYFPEPDDRLLMAIADPQIKIDVGTKLGERGAVFASYIHPTAVVAHDIRMGVGCILCPYAVACCNVQIGNWVSINVGSLIGHDSSLADGCTLSPHTDVAGQVELGRGVFLGCQTVIVPRIRIGEFARIGAGSVVISHVRSGSTMMGVPAKRVNWTKNQLDEDDAAKNAA